MKTLQWTGAFLTVTMVDVVNPANPTDDVVQDFLGHANPDFWQGDPNGTKLLGTKASDLVFLDNKLFSSPRLEDITVFDMRGGDDVVDLSSNRFSYGKAKLIGAGGDDWLFGNSGRDHILGGDGADRLKGNGGSDVIIGGNGDDQMFGGAQRDVFVVDASDGSDNIYDFATSGKQHDVVDVSQVAFIRDFDDLLAHAIMENGELKITFNDGNYLRMYHLDKSDLRADDFLF